MHPLPLSLAMDEAKAQTVWKEMSPGGRRPPGRATAASPPAAAAAAAAAPSTDALVAAATLDAGAGNGVPSMLRCTSVGRTRLLGRCPRVRWLGAMCGSGCSSAGSPAAAAAAGPPPDAVASAVTCCCAAAAAASCSAACRSSASSSVADDASSAAGGSAAAYRPGGLRPGLRCVRGRAMASDLLRKQGKKNARRGPPLKGQAGGGGGGGGHRVGAEAPAELQLPATS